MSQQALDFGRDHRVTEAYRRTMRALGDAVDAIGMLQAAGACGCRKPELADALACRDGRYMRLEWVLAILEIAPLDFRLAISAALTEWLGFAIKVGKPLTAEEKLRRLEARIAKKFGDAGEQFLAEVDRER